MIGLKAMNYLDSKNLLTLKPTDEVHVCKKCFSTTNLCSSLKDK